MNTLCIEFLQKKVDDLKALPTTYYHLLRLIGDPGCTATEIGRAIAADQVLSAKLLKLVNSSFCCLPSEVKNVSQAVSIIGLNGIHSMILTTSVVDVFLNGPGGRLFSRTDFWHHSLACAIASKIICRHLQGDEEEAFAAGLLHDIGKVIIDQYVTDKFIHILSQTRKFHISILNVETEVLGFNHLDTGTMIAQKWMLPASITEVIRYHHEPACAPRFPGLAAVVNIANSLAQAMEIGNSGNRFVPLVEPGLFSWLQMAIDLIEPIMEQTRQQFDKITDQMNQLV